MGEEPAVMARPADVAGVYRMHVRSIYAFIYSKVGNREAAEDLTSDVFVKALAHLDTGRNDASIAAWLYRVARNAVTDYWRVGGRAQVIALDDERLARAPIAVPDVRRQEQSAARAQAVLDRLPDNYRLVL
jgi:RNA polymerase sigma factor (sigma-70 family)